LAQRALEEEEAQIASLESRVAALTAALEDPELYTRSAGVEEAKKLGADLDDVKRELDHAFARWTAASEALQLIEQVD
jgi:ATP-binding cassette, subfamily F, member 3